MPMPHAELLEGVRARPEDRAQREVLADALLDSVPQAVTESGKLRPIVGSPPDLARLPAGCAFHPRCRFATATCQGVPPLRTDIPATAGQPRSSRCHRSCWRL